MLNHLREQLNLRVDMAELIVREGCHIRIQLLGRTIRAGFLEHLQQRVFANHGMDARRVVGSEPMQLQRMIKAVDDVLSGISQRAVKVEDEQFVVVSHRALFPG